MREVGWRSHSARQITVCLVIRFIWGSLAGKEVGALTGEEREVMYSMRSGKIEGEEK